MIESRINFNLSKEFSDGVSLKNANVVNSNEIHTIIKINHVSVSKNERRGFLCHMPEYEDLRFRLAKGTFNQIALFENEIVGFLTAFSNLEAIEYMSDGYLAYEDDILKSLLSEKFIWLDQLAIHPPQYLRRKIGTRLIKNIIEIAAQQGYKSFFGTISIDPEINLASINFLTTLGFEMVDTLVLNNRRWILIKLQLK